MLRLSAITIALILLVAVARNSYADHERFIIGEMRNVDPSAEIITSTSGTCIPSHDREILDCYFTSFGLWKAEKEADSKKHFDEFTQDLNKEPAKHINEMKRSFCDDAKKMPPDPLRAKYNAGAKRFFAAIKEFCDQPTRGSLLSLMRTLIEINATKCRCIVSDWRSKFERHGDRWVENTGPNGLCGVIKVFTLVPNDVQKMKDPTGPLLWTLHEKTVTTHGADNELCAKSLFRVEEGSLTVSWTAPPKTIDCSEIEFSSALEGMSDPRKR